ncbi:hypothetical protein DXG01_015083, partial [Tephrocybe rancida]
ALSTLLATLSLSSLPSSSTSNENDNNDILTALSDPTLTTTSSTSSSTTLSDHEKEVLTCLTLSIVGALKYDRIVATVATIVGLIGRVPGPAATTAAI